MAKFCSNCGNPIEDGSLFCDNCGAKLNLSNRQPTAAPKPQQPAPQPQPAQQPQYQQPVQQPKKNTGLIVGLIVAAVIAVAAIVTVIILLTSENSKQELPRREDLTGNVTERPAERPTEAPTETHTEAPTEAPTETPTEAPTETPTEPPTEAPLPYEESLAAPRGEDFIWISDAQSGSLTGSFLSNEELLGKWKGEFIHDGVWELVYVTIARDGTITMEPYQIYSGDWVDNSGAAVRTFRGTFDVSSIAGSGDAGSISLYTFLVNNGIQYGVGTCGGGNLYLTRP